MTRYLELLTVFVIQLLIRMRKDMFVYLVQHGEAEREEVDPARPLTEKGRNDVRKVAFFTAGAHVRVERIFHSGKLRARQTAEILGEVLKPSSGIMETDGLAPLDDPIIWAQRLQETTRDIMLTGHLPHLKRIAALLLCGTTERKAVAFAMGGIVTLERDDAGMWSLCWMVIPDLISQ
jgi:phosphohistidine phosphatase